MNLTQLCDRLLDLEEAVTHLDPHTLPPELKQALDDLLNDRTIAKEEYYAKINSIIQLIKDREAWAQIRKNRIKELKRLVEIDENLVDRLNNYLLNHLTANDLKKLRTVDYNVSIAKNGGKQPIVIDEINPDLLPDDLTISDRKINKDAIRDRLLQGETFDFARLGDRGTHLRIN